MAEDELLVSFGGDRPGHAGTAAAMCLDSAGLCAARSKKLAAGANPDDFEETLEFGNVRIWLVKPVRPPKLRATEARAAAADWLR